MTTRIVTDANGRKHITNEPLLHPPAQRTWVGLTRDEVLDIEETAKHLLDFAREVEANLKEKNNG
jgi:hypothetical protein